jgi:hypothetical protein
MTQEFDEFGEPLPEVNEHTCQPCPFCGSHDSHPVQVQVTTGTDPDYAVRCQHCDGLGPWALETAIAVELWNEGYPGSRPIARRHHERQQQKTKQQ